MDDENFCFLPKPLRVPLSFQKKKRTCDGFVNTSFKNRSNYNGTKPPHAERGGRAGGRGPRCGRSWWGRTELNFFPSYCSINIEILNI